MDIRLHEARPLNGAQSIRWNSDAHAEAHFSYPRAGQFRVTGGRKVIVTPEPGAEAALLRLYVQGMMLAAILHQRGLFVLHSSIVNSGDRCVAFVGSIGAGKSTMASGFHARGWSVVADDNAAIDLGRTPPTVLPAFPSLKIYPAVAAALGYDQSRLRPVHESQPKQAQAVASGFSTDPVPLDGIYVLDRDAAPEIQRLSAIESVTELIRNSVPTRWGVAGDGRHLKMCATLAERVPVYRVKTFTTLQQIGEVLDRIQDHHVGAL